MEIYEAARPKFTNLLGFIKEEYVLNTDKQIKVIVLNSLASLMPYLSCPKEEKDQMYLFYIDTIRPKIRQALVCIL